MVIYCFEFPFHCDHKLWLDYARVGANSTLSLNGNETDKDRTQTLNTFPKLFCHCLTKWFGFHSLLGFNIYRCNIPVIVMGETGCGKTRLIRYMCGLQAGPKGPRNMLLLKVN